MDKKKPVTKIYSYKVTMTVHVVADDREKARKQLDDQGGIVTIREVELLNESTLFGEQE